MTIHFSGHAFSVASERELAVLLRRLRREARQTIAGDLQLLQGGRDDHAVRGDLFCQRDGCDLTITPLGVALLKPKQVRHV